MKQRVLTALALAPIVLGALFLSPSWPLIILGSVAIFICVDELQTMLWGSPRRLTTTVALLIFLDLSTSQIFDLSRAIVYFLLTGLGISAIWAFSRKENQSERSWLPLTSCFWIVIPLLTVIQLHSIHSSTATWDFATPALLALLPLWGGDTAAIFAGKAFGKHLLAPAISPKKTVEGSVANLIVCVLVAVPLAKWIGYTPLAGALCGLAAGTLGQAGDLFESAVKRKAGVKDSGTLLPGHGGLLDRLDSLLFTAPAVAAILTVPGMRL